MPILAEPKEVEPVPVKEEDVSDDEPIVTGRAKRRRRTGEVNQEDRQVSESPHSRQLTLSIYLFSA